MLFLFIADIATAQISISEARKLRSGKTVTVSGTATASFGNLSFMQDTTGGIAIYNADIDVNDSISITGTLSKYNDMLEIVADSVAHLGIGKAIQPRPTTIVSVKDYEGQLVRIDDIRIPLNGLFFYPQQEGIVVQQADTLQYWIDENTDIPGCIAPETTNVTGVIGRFRDKVQLLPRSHFDIENAILQRSISNNQFKVVNWNVEFLGATRYGPTNDSLQIANVAGLLIENGPDIVALQEVSSDEAFKDLLKRLSGYDGRCSSRYSYSFDTTGDFPPQKVCFIYKTSTVNVIREKILFRKLFDDHPSDMFAGGRLPYLLEVVVMDRKFSVINIHAKSGATEMDYIRRLSDARILADSLSHKDFMLLGDFNDDLDQSIVAGHESPYSKFVNDDQYSCISKSLSDAGWHSTISYDDMIDHQIISSTLSEHHISTRILNPFGIPLYAQTTSDHLPIISEFDMTKVITGFSHEVKDQPVYPNPTHDDVWFPPNSNITILNSLGEIILKKEGAYPPISLGEYAPGLYSVVLWNQLFKIIRN